MPGPYRESQATSVDCPRCSKPLPATTDSIRACIASCGVWVSAEAAPELFARDELQPSRLTTWFRERTPCPHCSTTMTLRGHDMSLFMGCDDHGYWVDRETIGQTGLGRPALSAQLARARMAAETYAAELARAAAEAYEKEHAAEISAARRAAEEKRRLAEEEADRDRRIAEQLKILEPYLLVVQAAVVRRDLVPLADQLMRLDKTVGELMRRIAELEAALRR